MNAADILTITPKLSDGPTVSAQPSLNEIVAEHYRRAFGEEQGKIISDLYLNRLLDAVGSGFSPLPEAEPVHAENGDIPELAPHMKHDRTPLRMIVTAIVQNHYRITGGEKTTPARLQHYLQMWTADPRLKQVYEALNLDDVQGGFSQSEESPFHVVAIARALAKEGLLEKIDGGFLPQGKVERSPEPEAPAQAAPKPEAPKPEVRPEFPDAFEGIRGIVKEIGVDLKIGGIDVVKGIERSTRTGSALPLVTGIATALLAAAVASEANREG